MDNNKLTRRLFLQGSSALASSTVARTAIPAVLALAEAACTAKEDGAGFTVLGESEALGFAAIAERILPATDTPGATDAGVIWFMDGAFASFMRNDLAAARQGLADLQANLDGQQFANLDPAEQDQHLGRIEDTAFFSLMRNMTIFGFFGLSSYGGNKGNVGWKVLGVDDPVHTWQPPFGYYDAEYMQGEQNGE